MAKKKGVTRQVKHNEVYWPGPTRLYDPEVDCGAVMLTGEQARVLVKAYELAMDRDLLDGHEARWAETAANILRFNFLMGGKR